MARARNIKPSFFTNEQVADNCPLGRLLFIGLWTLADYKGDVEWKEKTIKIQILPWDNCDLKQLAINLDKSGLVRFYSDGNKIYLNIPNFEKHQNPHKNERDKGSEIPPYSNDYRQLIDFKELTINLDKSGLIASNRAESLILNPESLILNPESLIPQSQQVAHTSTGVDQPDPVNVIFDYWKERMNHPGAKLDDKRKKAIKNALKLKYSVGQLLAAIDGCAKSPWHMGKDPRNNKIFDALTLILRDAEHIDGFIKTNISPPSGSTDTRHRSLAENLTDRSWALGDEVKPPTTNNDFIEFEVENDTIQPP